MLRRLVTLLAILTGLAAFAAPAEARFAGVDGVRVELAASATQCHATKQAAVDSLTQAPAGFAAQSPCRTRKVIVVMLPTVQLGSDRARE